MWRMVSLVIVLGLGAYFYFGQMNARNTPERQEQIKQATKQAEALEKQINQQRRELDQLLEP